MAHLTNFSFEVFYKLFTEDASLPLLYHGAKKSKMTKNSNQGGFCLKAGPPPPLDLSFWSVLTILHHGIEKVERHLLRKFHKKFKGKVGQTRAK